MKRAAQDSEKFTKIHNVVNVSINSQIVNTPDFEQRITRAVPACVGCITARVIPASPCPKVLTNSSLCVARLIMYHTAETAIQTGQYFMELVYACMDGARPHDRPKLATHSEMQCVTHQPIAGTRRAFDYTGVDFEERDSKPGWIPVTWGKGGSYSIGIVKWHGATGAEYRTHNIAYSKFHTKTTQAMALNLINHV